MTTAEIVAPQLPYLRRYARALTGSQSTGDACVEATLEALVADPGRLASSTDARLALFRAFTAIWNALRAEGRAEPARAAAAADARLGEIGPAPRQAFLLTSLEGFSEADSARILGVDVATIRSLVDEAGRGLAAEIATDVMIIEDEPLIAMDIEAIVRSLGHAVLGVARTRAEAVALAAQKRPGLVLADIQLADGSSGLDAVNDLLEAFATPVIFVTAYPERFLTGERPEPAFLVAKPFQPANLSAVVSQALFFEQRAHRRPAIDAPV